MSCKPTYKGIRYNSLEELYRANGINSEQKQQAQQLYSQYLENLSTNNIKPGVTELSENNPELANAIYEALGFNFRYTSEKWKDDPTKENKATYINIKGTPSNQEFQIKKDLEDGFYSVHFKTEQGKLTKEQIQTLVDAIASQIPIGGKLSTWGEITKGGISGLNRFLNNGFKKVGEREIKDKEGSSIVIPILEKVEKSNLEQQALQLYSKYLENFSTNNIKPGVTELFESNPDFANKVYEALGFKEQQYVSKLKEIAGRRKLATKSDLENSQLIKDLRVDKSQPKTLKPNAADNNLAAIMLYGMKMSELKDKGLSEEMMEATTLAYRILNDFMFDMDELVFYQDILLENPEYASVLSTNENPVKEFFENDIFEQADKEKFEITPEQKQEAQKLYSQYLNTIFPDSKVKDIVYHGSKDKIEKFNKPTAELSLGKPAIYFRKDYNKHIKDSKVSTSVIVNSEFPFIADDFLDYQERRSKRVFFDSVYIKNEDEFAVFEPEQIHILGSKQDIQGFKEFVDKPIFDKELAQKIQDKLQKLYPEIKLNITNNPIWEQGNNIFDQKQALENEVAYRLKVVNSLINLTIPKGDKRYSLGDKPEVVTIRLNSKKQPYIETNLRKRLNGKGVTNQQIDFIFDYMKSNNIQEISTEQLALELASKYGFSVEINTAKVPLGSIAENEERIDGAIEGENTKTYDYLSARNFENKSKYKKEDGWEYAELDITTPLISPSIESHAGFANKKNSIGWVRVWYNKKTGAVEIQEIQSDLFQKGRNKEELVKTSKETQYSREDLFLYEDRLYSKKNIGGETYYLKDNTRIDKEEFDSKLSLVKLNLNSNENQFLQLLNKDSNWVTFFIKSIIQDSAKKGYEKVLFPKGENAANIEGHETIADAILRIDKDIEESKHKVEVLKNRLSTKDFKLFKYTSKDGSISHTIDDIKNHPKGEEWVLKYHNVEDITDESIEEAKKNIKSQEDYIIGKEQEKANLESQGIEKLKPIEAFYEIKVGNILEKLFGKENVKTITDEFGNQWREITINQARDLQNILLQKDEANRIIGQANVKAMTVLIDAVNQKQDTLPHEYAHHYIAWFRNTPIVQEAIKKWGSEEALVQSIGEQVVKQKGEAYNWWNNFVKWIMNQFNSLSKLQKEELTQILTDAFLTRQDLGSKQDIQGFKDFVQGKQYMVDNSETQYSKKENKVKPLAERKGVTYNDINNINVFC